jgi:hypothetical protein
VKSANPKLERSEMDELLAECRRQQEATAAPPTPTTGMAQAAQREQLRDQLAHSESNSALLREQLREQLRERPDSSGGLSPSSAKKEPKPPPVPRTMGGSGTAPAPQLGSGRGGAALKAKPPRPN